MTIITRASKGSALTYGEVDGNFTQINTKIADGWKDLVCGLDVRSGASSPVLTNFRDGIYLWEFSSSVLMEFFANAHIGHDYKVGTMLYPHIHWTVNTASVGTVRWGYEYTWARRHDSTGQVHFPATQTIYVEQATDGDVYGHYVAETAEGFGVPADTIEVDTLILFRVFRDAAHPNDTFPDPVFGFTFDLHYECDRDATPLRAPPFY